MKQKAKIIFSKNLVYNPLSAAYGPPIHVIKVIAKFVTSGSLLVLKCLVNA